MNPLDSLYHSMASLEAKGKLLITGLKPGTGKASQKPFLMVSVLQLHDSAGAVGASAETFFADPAIQHDWKGPGFYVPEWEIQVRQGSGSARLIGIKPTAVKAPG